MTDLFLKDRIALVTGGSRGIGKEIAGGLAAAGAQVAIVGRTQDELRFTAATFQQSGLHVTPFTADVTDRHSMHEIVTALERQFGRLDVVVNNAAIDGPFGPIWEVLPDEWLRTLDVNLNGAFNVIRAALPGMVSRHAGRIINVASIGGLWPIPFDTAYATSKAALIRLTEVMALECEPMGVCVWAIHPGVVRTSMAEYVMDSAAGRQWLPRYSEMLEVHQTPVAWASELCVFLASGAADGLTGRFISVTDAYRTMARQVDDLRKTDMHMMRLQRPASRRVPPMFQE